MMFIFSDIFMFNFDEVIRKYHIPDLKETQEDCLIFQYENSDSIRFKTSSSIVALIESFVIEAGLDIHSSKDFFHALIP